VCPAPVRVSYVLVTWLLVAAGIAFCMNRPSALFVAPSPFAADPPTPPPSPQSSAPSPPQSSVVDRRTNNTSSSSSSSSSAAHRRITSSYFAQSPLFSRDGGALLFTAVEREFIPHRAGVQLRRVAWPPPPDTDAADASPSTRVVATSTAPREPLSRVLVDVVASPAATDFPGLYVHGPTSTGVWHPDGRRLLVNTVWRSRATFVSVDADSGTVVDEGARVLRDLASHPSATPDASHDNARLDSVRLMDVCDAGYLVRVESPVDVAALAFVPFASRVPSVDVPRVSPAAQRLIHGARWQLVTVTPSKDAAGPNFGTFEAILALPRDASAARPAPMVVVPHGGPHGVYPTVFSPFVGYLVSQGFAVLQVNYRGSIGFGEAQLHSLVGRAGASCSCGTRTLRVYPETLVAVLTSLCRVRGRAGRRGRGCGGGVRQWRRS
jgi:hypothetical protein